MSADTLQHRKEVVSMPSAGFFTSALNSGIGQLIAAIVGIAAIYKFFIEFVEPDEMAIRTRNNKPDSYHYKMSWLRGFVVIVSLVVMLDAIVFAFRSGWNAWHFWLAELLLAALVYYRAISTWPRTGVTALVGPGFKLKIPGWIAYKRAKVALFTRAVHITERVDGSGELVNVDVLYVYARGTPAMRVLWEGRARVVQLVCTHELAINEAAKLLWGSMFGVANLEESLDGIVLEAALRAIGSTPDMSHLDAKGMATLSSAILLDCGPRFQVEFGATVYTVRLVRSGPPAQVAAMQKLVEVLQNTLTLVQELTSRLLG